MRIKRVVWVNIYHGGNTVVFGSRAAADEAATQSRIACVQLTIECKEGEGL